MRVWNVLLARHFKNNKYDKPQLLSPHAVTTEAHVPRACALQRSPHTTSFKKKKKWVDMNRQFTKEEMLCKCNNECYQKNSHSLVNNNMQNKGYDADFFGGTVDKNLSASAGDTDLIPGPRWFHMPRSTWAHPPQLLNLCVANTEPVCCNYWSSHVLETILSNKRSHLNVKPMHHNKE